MKSQVNPIEKKELYDTAAVVPVKNRPELLKEALFSILNGRALPTSIHTVIDSGPDEGIQDRRVADEIKIFIKDNNIPVLLHTHYTYGIGPGGARNYGAKMASETWIAFLDSDDTWEKDKLEIQMKYLKKRPHLKAVSGYETWIKNGKKLNQPLHLKPGHGKFLSESLSRCLVACSSVIIEKEEFLGMEGFDENFPVCEDFDFWIRFLLHHPIGLVHKEIAVKRSGNWDQLSQNHSLDYYRILSLLKNVNHINFPEELRGEAEKNCRFMLGILKNGALKRNRPGDFLDLEERINQTFASVNG